MSVDAKGLTSVPALEENKAAQVPERGSAWAVTRSAHSKRRSTERRRRTRDEDSTPCMTSSGDRTCSRRLGPPPGPTAAHSASTGRPSRKSRKKASLEVWIVRYPTPERQPPTEPTTTTSRLRTVIGNCVPRKPEEGFTQVPGFKTGTGILRESATTWEREVAHEDADVTASPELGRPWASPCSTRVSSSSRAGGSRITLAPATWGAAPDRREPDPLEEVEQKVFALRALHAEPGEAEGGTSFGETVAPSRPSGAIEVARH